MRIVRENRKNIILRGRVLVGSIVGLLILVVCMTTLIRNFGGKFNGEVCRRRGFVSRLLRDILFIVRLALLAMVLSLLLLLLLMMLLLLLLLLLRLLRLLTFFFKAQWPLILRFWSTIV